MFQNFVNFFRVLPRLIILVALQIIGRLFFRYDIQYLNNAKKDFPWDEVRLIVFLNHTSLFEPLFLSALPTKAILSITPKLILPGADATLKRPIVGRLLKFMFPNFVAISRQRDETWNRFLDHIKSGNPIAIAPEGRMKRRNGLDKFGKPMSIRSGVVDILEQIPEGKMMILTSGGLHHVQAPGEKHVHLFQTIHGLIEVFDIHEYKYRMYHEAQGNLKDGVITDLTKRLKRITEAS